jgi:hypothetical protein
MLIYRFVLFNKAFQDQKKFLHYGEINLFISASVKKLFLAAALNHIVLFTYFTILGWSNSFSNEISLIAVHGTPSSSESNLIRFNATISPVSSKKQNAW